MQLLSGKAEAAFVSQVPSGSQAVARLQLFRPALVLPPACPEHLGQGERVSNRRPHQLEPVFSAILLGDPLCSGRYTEEPGVQCRCRWPESLCHLTFLCRERGCGISRELGLRGSS